MLLAIRERIMGVVGWILLGILSIAFAFFGLESYMQSSASNYAARVNDVEISVGRQQRAYEGLRNRMQSMLGDNYDPALLNEDLLKANALQQLITQELLRQAADSAGFATSDQLVAAQISAVKEFQSDGAFSRERYERILGLQGMSPAEFEWRLKMDSMASQLSSGIVQTAAATPASTKLAFQLQKQKRRFRYLVLRTRNFAEQVDASDEDIQGYYDANADEFMIPERLRVQYVELNADTISASIDTEEADIQALYSEQSERFTTPEQRKARHILISLLPDADEPTVEAARQEAETVIKRLDAGEAFEDLASEVSDDPVSASKGGDLGFFGRGAMVPAFEEAVFALNAGERSDIVKSSYGFHVVEVMEIKPEVITPLDEVRDELSKQLSEQVRADLFYDKSEILSTLAFEQPDTLQVAAETLGLEIRESDWLTRSGGAGIGTHSAVVNAAFSEEVLLNGYNSAPVEIGDNHMVVIRVLEHQQPSKRELEDVRDTVRQNVIDSKLRELVSTKGSELLEQLKSGKALESIAEDEGLELQQTDLLGRDATQVDRALVQTAYKLQHPQSGQPVYGSRILATGDYALIALDEVSTGDYETLPDATRNQAWEQMNQIQGATELRAVIESLRNTASISIPESSDQL